MRLGIVSDTHGHLENARAAARVLEAEQVDAVLHCGDIGTPAVIAEFVGWPTHFVFGNCDHDPALLRGAIRDNGLTCHERYGELELAGRRIALLHSDDAGAFQEAILCGRHDLVCYGHTHVPLAQRRGPTLILNPGAMYRAHPHTLAIVELETLEHRFVEVTTG